MFGTLYMVATPIGNLEDMSYRAVRILGEVDLIAAEDTRNSIKLLNHFEIKKPLTSYHEFNRYDKADILVDKLEQGMNIAVITDAGTPGISDPGEVLVEMCIERGITVVPVPGAVAGINALIASGQSTRRFVFEGFIPQDKKERAEVLERMAEETRTIIVYEAPHRLAKTLKVLADCLGGDRSITICKELTKKHESFLKTCIAEALNLYESEEPKGEYVLVIAGRSKEEILDEKKAMWENVPVREHLLKYINDGVSKKDAIKLVAEERGVSKKEIYKESIDL